jgi:hypothetical protein
MICSAMSTVSLILAAGLISAFPSASKGDDPLVGYRVVLVGLGGHFGEPKGELGIYGTWDEASKAGLAWGESHSNDFGTTWTIEKVRGKEKLRKAIDAAQTIREAKEAVDKAKEISRGGWLKAYSPKERRFLDTLKEYQSSVRDGWKRVSDAKATLVSGTQGIMKKEFNDINNLIADFDRQAATYNDAARLAGFETVQTISPVTTTIKFQNPGIVDVGQSDDRVQGWDVCSQRRHRRSRPLAARGQRCRNGGRDFGLSWGRERRWNQRLPVLQGSPAV